VGAGEIVEYHAAVFCSCPLEHCDSPRTNSSKVRERFGPEIPILATHLGLLVTLLGIRFFASICIPPAGALDLG
jgi:hypothetical protein